jgi:CRISPR-associated protein Cst2
VLKVIDAIMSLREVGGNHSRFLFDFSPSSVVFRWTDDFAPRMLYGFEMDAEGNVSFPGVLKKVECGDLDPKELFIGGEVAETLDDEAKEKLRGAAIAGGVKATARKLRERIMADLGITGE